MIISKHHLLLCCLFFGVLVPLRAIPMEGKEGYVENNSQLRRTTEDRAAIERARTGGEGDRSSLLERADTVVALGEKKSEQTPFPAVRDDQALNELQHDNEVAHQFLNGLNELVTLIKAQKTMVCLNAIDYMNLSPESEPFYANNRGGDASTIKLIMNDPAKPFLLAVPSSDDNGWLPDIEAAENRDKPITLGDLSAAFGKAAEWIEKGNVPKKQIFQKNFMIYRPLWLSLLLSTQL